MLKKSAKKKEHKSIIESVIPLFLRSREARGFTTGTVRFYHQNMNWFIQFAKAANLTYMEEFDQIQLDAYMKWMTDQGHNDGGKFMAYRTVKTLVRWFMKNYDPEEYRDPFEGYLGVKKPKLIQDPVPADTVERMIASCPAGKYTGDRDRAILMTLFDTGVRASELCNMNNADLDIEGGTIQIRHGKGDKARVVMFGELTQRALRKYLRHWSDLPPDQALFAQSNGSRLSYWGLRDLIHDRAKAAGVDKPPLHAFRRGFAIYCLRNGMDIYSLQHLMGHADLQVLRLYLKQTEEDLKRAHARSSPMDHLRPKNRR